MAVVGSKIASIEAVIGYTFTNKLLCAEGLQMGGAPGWIWLERQTYAVEKNTRLAVLGDAIMAAVLVEKWYKHRHAQGTALSKGQWDQLRQTLNNGNLASIGRTHGIDAAILRNAGLHLVSNEMVATTLEAIIGAAHVDAGANDLTVVRDIMDTLGFFKHPIFTAPSTASSQPP